ncbi:hypothetical protein E9993_05255 [Labilibacter sediminis]|nr:hypothetical protein E9993_05255 [Labilibacter sediminis]
MKSLIRKFLTLIGAENLIDKLYNGYFTFKERLQYAILYPVILKIPFAQNFYFVFSKSFGHELKMFISARKDYLKKKHNKTDNLFLLRRNIHRLEKGLLMKNRRNIFALDYIEETVELFKNIAETTPYNDQIKWANDILTEYFKVTSSAPKIDRAHKIYKPIILKLDTSLTFTPYLAKTHHVNSKEAFKTLAQNRKSVRYFDNTKLPDRKLMDEAVEIAALAPSSCNRQPFYFRIIDEPEMVKKVSHLPGGTKGFAENIVAIVAVIGQMNVSPSISDRHLMYVDGSLAAMNFMLALESMGIASCPLNWPEDKAKDNIAGKILGLDKYERPIMMIAYGYAAEDGKLACSVRKPLEQLRKYN